MKDLHKVSRLIEKLDDFIVELENTNALIIHQQIDQFYYMQKREALAILCHEINTLRQQEERLELTLGILYPEVFIQWKSDVLWYTRRKVEKEVQ